jgi:hypothetical protein
LRYKPDQCFRASIDIMDDTEDCKTYVAEYFSWKVLRHGEAVFAELQEAEQFLLAVYAEDAPDIPVSERQSRMIPYRESHPKSAQTSA